MILKIVTNVWKNIEDYKDSGEMIVKYETKMEYQTNKQMYDNAAELRMNGEYQEALEIYSKIIDFENVESEIIETYIEFAESLFASGNYDDAVFYFEEAEYNESNYQEACYLLAQEYLEKNGYSIALQWFEKVNPYKESGQYIHLKFVLFLHKFCHMLVDT